MALLDDISADVDGILTQAWGVRDGQVVPETADVALAGGAVRLDATMLYADLADSTELAMGVDRRVVAKVYKSFLAAATRVIRARGGAVRSFDGDRVMGVFVGDAKNSIAAKCALQINYAFTKVVRPKLEAKYTALGDGTHPLRHAVGVDTSEVLVVRSGIRNNNDLVWVGRAPNVAAKLSALRESPYHSFLTAAVYARLNAESKLGSDGREMWERRTWSAVSGVDVVYRSSWWWAP